MRRFVSLVLFVLLALPALAEAQSRPQTREGFWIGFGLGGGSFGCDECGDEDRLTGAAAYFKLGGTVNQNVLLGAEINGWAKSEDGATLSLSNVNAVIYLYPSKTGGFHFKGGIGLATVRFEIGDVEADETGGGAVLGIGYDARVGKNFSLTPFLNVTAGRFDNGYKANTVQVGLGASWH